MRAFLIIASFAAIPAFADGNNITTESVQVPIKRILDLRGGDSFNILLGLSLTPRNGDDRTLVYELPGKTETSPKCVFSMPNVDHVDRIDIARLSEWKVVQEPQHSYLSGKDKFKIIDPRTNRVMLVKCRDDVELRDLQLIGLYPDSHREVPVRVEHLGGPAPEPEPTATTAARPGSVIAQ